MLTRSSPRQTNGKDCGVFVLVNALHLGACLPLPVTIDSDLWRSLFAHLLAPLMPHERRALQRFAEQTAEDMAADLVTLDDRIGANTTPVSQGESSTEPLQVQAITDEGVSKLQQASQGESPITQLAQTAISSVRSLRSAATSIRSAVERAKAQRTSLRVVDAVVDAMQSLTTKRLRSLAASGTAILGQCATYRQIVETARRGLPTDKVANADALHALDKSQRVIEADRRQWMADAFVAAIARTRWLRASSWLRGQSLRESMMGREDNNGTSEEDTASASSPNGLHALAVLADLPAPVGAQQVDRRIAELTAQLTQVDKALSDLREVLTQ